MAVHGTYIVNEWGHPHKKNGLGMRLAEGGVLFPAQVIVTSSMEILDRGSKLN